MDKYQDEESIRGQHMIRKRSRYRQFEKRCKGTVSGYWNQDHSHGYVTQVASQGNGSESIASTANTTGNTALNEVVAQSDPPYSNNNGVQGDDP